MDVAMATPKQVEATPSAIREHYREFLDLLHQRREEIIGRRDNEEAQANEQLPDGPGDVADLSVLDTSADYFLNLAEAHRRELVEIQSALDRLERGAYGVCESCNEEIAMGRLKNLPYARLCVDCQAGTEGRVAHIRPYNSLKPRI